MDCTTAEVVDAGDHFFVMGLSSTWITPIPTASRRRCCSSEDSSGASWSKRDSIAPRLRRSPTSPAIVVFVAIGRRNHDEGTAVDGIATVAAPFLIALAVGWIVARAWTRPMQVEAAFIIWPVTVALGLVLRNVVFDRGTALPFIIVATSSPACSWSAGEWSRRFWAVSQLESLSNSGPCLRSSASVVTPLSCITERS